MEQLFNRLKEIDSEIQIKKEEQEKIKQEICNNSKYKIGETVCFEDRGKVIPGIITKIDVLKTWSKNDNYYIGYYLAKVKKDGKAHATASASWRELREDELSPIQSM